MSSLFDCSAANWTRRRFISQGSLGLVCAAALSNGKVLADGEKREFIEVETKCGRLRGLKNEGLANFQGIPYAGAVSGPHRFKVAPPLEPWTGVHCSNRDETAFFFMESHDGSLKDRVRAHYSGFMANSYGSKQSHW